MDIVTLRTGVQFQRDPAAAFVRAEAQVRREFGRDIRVNSTYRSWDQQMAMHIASTKWLAGTGPYPGHSYATHPMYSRHVSGLALDSPDWVLPRIVQILAENGFIRNQLHVPNEQHHFEYLADQDQHRGQFSGTPGVPIEEDDMPLNNADKEIIRKIIREEIAGAGLAKQSTVTWIKSKLGGKVTDTISKTLTTILSKL